MSIPARVTSLGSLHMQMNASKQPLAIAANPPATNTNTTTNTNNNNPKSSSSMLLHANSNNSNSNNLPPPLQSATRRMSNQVAGINMLSKQLSSNQTAAASANALLADKRMSEEHQMYCELWHACAGPLVSVPLKGSRVVYFPQGHLEQVAASMKLQLGAEQQIPLYDLPPQIVCRVAELSLHADRETDEVFAQFTLVPLPQERQNCMEPEVPLPQKLATHMFCKTLTVSDTSTHGGFSVPRRAADECFAPLDYSQQRPSQEIVAKDLHGVEWKFRHIYRGQPRRHLLTTGWSLFVSSKKLVAGDSVLFLRKGNGELWVGIRRGNNRPAAATTSSSSCQAIGPATSVLPSHSMHMGVLAAAAHALSTKSMFNVFYNPRTSASEFVISHHKYRKAFAHTLSVGMRFKMRFETEDGMERRYTGTISGIGDVDPGRWKDSKWRSLKVTWDDQQSSDGSTTTTSTTTGGMFHGHNSGGASCRVRRRNEQQVSAWEIEPFLANSASLLADNLNLIHLPGIMGTGGGIGAIGSAALHKRRHWSATYNVPPAIDFGSGSGSVSGPGSATSSMSPCNNNLLAYTIHQQQHHQSEETAKNPSNNDPMSFVNGDGVKRLRRMPGSNAEAGFLPAMVNSDQQKLVMQGLMMNHHHGSAPQKPSLILGQHHQGLNTSSSSSSSYSSSSSSVTSRPNSLLRSQQTNLSPLFWPSLMPPAMASSASGMIKTPTAHLPPLPHHHHQIQPLHSSQLCNPNPSNRSSAVPVVVTTTSSSSGDGTTMSTSPQSSHESIMPVGVMLHAMIANPNLALNSEAMDMDSTTKAVQCSSPEENHSKDSTQTGSSSNQAEAKGNQLKLFGFSLKNAYKLSNPSDGDDHHDHDHDEPRLSVSPRGSNYVFDESSLSLSLSPKVNQAVPESKEETSLPVAYHQNQVVTEKALRVYSSSTSEDQSEEEKQDVEVQLWPSQAQQNECHLISSRNRVKVLKKGHHVGRSIDLSKFNCYPELIQALEKLFNMEGQLSCRSSDDKMGWQITYTDNDGDTMLVGDDPWEEFVNIALKICIVTREELITTSSAPGQSKLSEDCSSPL